MSMILANFNPILLPSVIYESCYVRLHLNNQEEAKILPSYFSKVSPALQYLVIKKYMLQVKLLLEDNIHVSIFLYSSLKITICL